MYEKPKGSEETMKRVVDTVEELGFKADKAVMSLARKTIRIEFIINELEVL